MARCDAGARRRSIPRPMPTATVKRPFLHRGHPAKFEPIERLPIEDNAQAPMVGVMGSHWVVPKPTRGGFAHLKG
jgi:hypothetical protein